MALNITIGRSYSESFVSVGEADSIMAGLPYDSSDWMALSTAEKEYRLRLGAEALGYLSFRGRMAFENQALCFPRDCQINMMTIPLSVKRAQVDIAYSVIHKAITALPSVDTTLAAGRLSSMTLGGLLAFKIAGDPVQSGNILDSISRSVHLSVYLELKRYLTSIRGWSVADADEVVYHTLSTTSTTSTSTSTSSTLSTISTTTST